tara:strand:+ start:2329 stop:5988 length:3660 start_codon:yes stop_codon:yes gene_type:complete
MSDVSPGATEVDALRAGGFSDPEIQQYVAGQRKTFSEAGFTEIEVDEYFGKPPIDDGPIFKWANETIDEALDEIVGPAVDVDPNKDDDVQDFQRPDVLDVLKKGIEVGYQGSATGLFVRGEMPDVELGEDAGAIARLSSQMSGLVTDFPIMVAGAIGGAPAGTATMGPGLGTIAGAGAGAFALPAALREALMEGYKNGSIDDFGEFIDRVGAILLEAAKGAATGASTMTAGGLAKGPVAKFGAELTTLVTVSKGLEGEVPTPTDFLEGAIILFALKGAVKVAGKGTTALQKQTVMAQSVLRNIYAKTGKRPQDVLEDARNDPTVLSDVMSMMDPANGGMVVPRSYERLTERGVVALPIEPTPVNRAVNALSTAQQTVRDRISVGEKDAPKTFRETVDKIYTEGIDKLYPLARLVDKLRDGEVLKANEDPYKGARFLPAASAKAQLFLDFEVRKFGSTEVVSRGLKQILEPVKDDLDGIRVYAASKRSIELSQRDTPAETGIDIRAAKQVVKEGSQKYQPVFEEMVKYQNAVTAYLKDSGIISQNMFDKMVEANKDYVDFHRFFDPSQTGGTGRGSTVRNPIKALKGSDRRVIDPLESIIKNTYLYTNLAESNAVNVKLVELAERKGGTGEGSLVQKVNQPRVPTTLDAKEMKAIAKQVKDEFGVVFTPEELTVFRARTLQPTDSQFVVFRNGKRELFEVDREVGIAMNGMDVGSANMLVKFLTVPAKTLRAGAILNPEFFAKNMFRDTVSATIFSTRGFRPFVDTVLGGMSLISKDTAFRDWMMSGGANATLVSIDRLYLQQSLQKLTQDTGLMTRAINVVKSPLEVLRVGSELAENATRLGAFKRKTRGDRSQEALAEGGFESREVTLDFARIGASMQGYNRITAFINARFQGYDRFVRALIDNPGKTIGVGVVTITMPSVALWFANNEDPRWPGIPQWQKDVFWIVLTKDHIHRFPKPFEPGIIFGTIPEHLLENFKKSNPDAIKKMFKAFTYDSLASFTPTSLTPFVENITNHSFFRGAPLVPARLEDQLPEYRYTEYTSELAKKVALITGKVGVTPIDVENYVRQLSGGLGTYAMRLADFGLRKAGVLPDPPRPADTLADIPFVKAFTIRHPSAGAQPIIDFYNNFEQANQIKQTFLRLTKEGDTAEAEKVRALDDRAMFSLTGMRTSIGQLSTLARTLFKNPDIPKEEKRQLIDQIYRDMSTLAEAGNNIMKDD